MSRPAVAPASAPNVGGGPHGASARDELFAHPRPQASDFDFGPGTAAVFDDMLDRSVPLYPEILRMVGDLASTFAQPGSQIYDLGCATGGGLLAVAARLPDDRGIQLVGVDASRAMLDQARAKLAPAHVARTVELREGDLERGVTVENASVVLLVLTLQFLRPIGRARLLERILAGLIPGGCLIVVEKVVTTDPMLNRVFMKHYYAFKKRQGYSDLEIAQKRDALENVLVPYRLEENVELLRGAGFHTVQPFFQWFNFAGIVALRSAAASERAEGQS